MTFSPKTIGLIKGGQLALMLIEAGIPLGLHFHVLDNDPEAPCRPYCSAFTLGDAQDADTVFAFGQAVDAVVLEFEHVSVAGLQRLESAGIPVFPTAAVLAMVQDKGLQKQFYVQENIPTAPFVLVDTPEALAQQTDFFPGVIKTRRAGYDGNGVAVLKDAQDLPAHFSGPLLLEKKIDFDKEISVIIARSAAGEMAVYPVIEWQTHEHKDLVDLLFAPANISSKTAQEAVEIAKKIVTVLDYVGLLAVEMFVVKDRVLVNEMSPRPHNSGHHTIEANLTSQYQQLLRCVLGMPLGATEARSAAALFNVLGEPGFEGPAQWEGVDKCMALPTAFVHSYGKTHTKPLRKMGHVTVIAPTVSEALAQLATIKEKVRVIS
ncbi:MAG: 5-(carboxyamino)imidazole ribonucleotide synthase [Candidatus Margulisiibacteriota bacterium]